MGIKNWLYYSLVPPSETLDGVPCVHVEEVQRHITAAVEPLVNCLIPNQQYMMQNTLKSTGCMDRSLYWELT